MDNGIDFGRFQIISPEIDSKQERRSIGLGHVLFTTDSCKERSAGENMVGRTLGQKTHQGGALLFIYSLVPPLLVINESYNDLNFLK